MKNKLSVIIIPIVISIILIIGIFVGKLMNNQTSKNPFVVYPKVDKLHAVLNYISQEYVDTVNQEELIENALTVL